MKKAEKLYDGITEVRDDLVQEAGAHRFAKKRSPLRWTAVAAACLALALVLSALLPGGGIPSILDSSSPGSLFPTAYALSLPEYPEMADYSGPDAGDSAIQKWNDGLNAQRRDGSYAEGLQPYLDAAVTQFLSDSGG